jgi:hypothetical protein
MKSQMCDWTSAILTAVFGLMVLLVVNLPFPLAAEEWKSNDGFISLTVPEGFTVDDEALKLDPALLKVWIREIENSHDVCRFAVAKFPIPGKIPLSQKENVLSGFIKGATEQFTDTCKNVQVLKSSSGESPEGFLFVDATLSGELSESHLTMIIRQRAWFINTTGYKVMALGYNFNPDDIPEITQSLASLKIHAMPDPHLKTLKKLTPEERMEKLGEAIGRGCFFLFFAALIFWFISRAFRKKKQSHSAPKEWNGFE